MSPQPLPPRPLLVDELVELTRSDASEFTFAMVAGRPDDGLAYVVHAVGPERAYLLGFDEEEGRWEELVTNEGEVDEHRARYAEDHDEATAAVLALRDATEAWLAEVYPDGDLTVLQPDARGTTPL